MAHRRDTGRGGEPAGWPRLGPLAPGRGKSGLQRAGCWL